MRRIRNLVKAVLARRARAMANGDPFAEMFAEALKPCPRGAKVLVPVQANLGTRRHRIRTRRIEA